ncbi:MAG: thymidine kinase [Candidatus Micrarchaeia archaeon]
MAKGESGRFVTITGPMFSGKTSRLIELLEREQYAGRKIILFKPAIDNRYSTVNVSTHKGITLPAVVAPIGKEALPLMRERANSADAIGVDELQFWKSDSGVVEFLEGLSDSGKNVYVATLNRDHTGRPFENTTKALSVADEIHMLTAVCAKCGADATFSQRILNGKESFGKRIVIGGKESYEPRCRHCFIRPK